MKQGKMSDVEYVTKGGGTCPACGSVSIEGGAIDIDGATAVQKVSCLHCNAIWNDLYQMTGYCDLVLDA